MNWTAEDIPDQTGKTAIVTGANTGIGFETARALARKGARVILACRHEERGKDALRRIKTRQPAGSATLMLLDLASLDAVRRFAVAFLDAYDTLDLLINNAGVMIPPFGTTEDGFELQIGVNFLGHFALTGLLLDTLASTPGARVVTLSSLAHRSGRIHLDRFEGGAFDGSLTYKPWREYNQSKLADLMFALELHRRLAAEEGQATHSLAAHPGLTDSDLQRHNRLVGFFTGLWSNDTEQGALPTLFAATSPETEPGGYYGPDGFYEMRGYPAPAKVMPQARNERRARQLWERAEELTDVRYLSGSPGH